MAPTILVQGKSFHGADDIVVEIVLDRGAYRVCRGKDHDRDSPGDQGIFDRRRS